MKKKNIDKKVALSIGGLSVLCCLLYTSDAADDRDSV